MHIEIGLPGVRKIEGMTKTVPNEKGDPLSKEVPSADYYFVQFSVSINHEVSDETDLPVDNTMSVRIKILENDESFDSIVLRAKNQLRQDALEIAKLLNKQ